MATTFLLSLFVHVANELLSIMLLLIFVIMVLQPAKRTAYAGGSDRVFAPVDRELVFDIVGSFPYSIMILRFQLDYARALGGLIVSSGL